MRRSDGLPASLSDLHESRGDPLQGPFDQSRHLQPGGHSHPHADRHPALEVKRYPAFRLPLLPVHSKWGAAGGGWGWSISLLRRVALSLTAHTSDGMMVKYDHHPLW